MLTRYRDNLHLEGDEVYSYSTNVATIDHANRKLYVYGWWSVTTSKHINYVAREYGLTIEKRDRKEEPEETGGELKTIKMVMTMGNIFGKDQKEKNDWKARMLKAGLENKGLIMPNDWNQLPEPEKEKRLNKVIANL